MPQKPGTLPSGGCLKMITLIPWLVACSLAKRGKRR